MGGEKHTPVSPASKRVVTIQLGNRWSYFIGAYPRDAIKRMVSYQPNGYYFSPKYRMKLWDGWISLLRRDRIPTGLFVAMQGEMEKELNIEFATIDEIERVEFTDPEVVSDRLYQNECIDAMVMGAVHGGGLILSATGSGKTFVTGLLFKRLLGAGCFVVDELTLLDQAREELSGVLGEPIGLVGRSIFDPQRITVATVQTLHRCRNDRRFKPWTRSLKVIVVDEVHTALNRRNFGTVEAIKPPIVYGITATLGLEAPAIRLRAFALAGPVLFHYDLAHGQDQGFLARGLVVQVVHNQKPIPDAHYPERYDKLVVNSRSRNDLIVALVREGFRRGKHIIVLVERIAHIKAISQGLQKLLHKVVCGAVPSSERTEAKQQFEAGDLRIIITNRVFKKGIDIKRVDVIIDGAATQSAEDAIQKFGRGARLTPGKIGLLHFDIADDGNYFRTNGRSRRRAFRRTGIPITTVSSDVDVRHIYDRAEHILGELVRDKS